MIGRALAAQHLPEQQGDTQAHCNAKKQMAGAQADCQPGAKSDECGRHQRILAESIHSLLENHAGAVGEHLGGVLHHH